MTEYALYLGDEFITIDTQENIAKKLGVKTNTVHFYSTPGYKRSLSKRKNIKRTPITVKLENTNSY